MEGCFLHWLLDSPVPSPEQYTEAPSGTAGDKLPSAPTNAILFKTRYRKAEQLLGLNPVCSWRLGEAARRDSCELTPVSRCWQGPVAQGCLRSTSAISDRDGWGALRS